MCENLPDNNNSNMNGQHRKLLLNPKISNKLNVSAKN